MNLLIHSKDWKRKSFTMHYADAGKCLCNGHSPNKIDRITKDLDDVDCLQCEIILSNHQPMPDYYPYD